MESTLYLGSGRHSSIGTLAHSSLRWGRQDSFATSFQQGRPASVITNFHLHLNIFFFKYYILVTSKWECSIIWRTSSFYHHCCCAAKSPLRYWGQILSPWLADGCRTSPLAWVAWRAGRSTLSQSPLYSPVWLPFLTLAVLNSIPAS